MRTWAWGKYKHRPPEGGGAMPAPNDPTKPTLTFQFPPPQKGAVQSDIETVHSPTSIVSILTAPGKERCEMKA
jgi:hypothetical protein